MLRKLGEDDGSDEILTALRHGDISYVVNTRDLSSSLTLSDGHILRQCAVENNVTMFTSLDTVRVLLDVLEETAFRISTIDS